MRPRHLPSRLPVAAALTGALACIGVTVWALLAAIPSESRVPAPIPPPPARLSETGLWSDPATRAVAPGILTWAPQYPLWSDGAAKRRWIRLPEGASIDASDPDAWQFPIGTRLWKEFAFGRPVETRMIERLPDGTWRFLAYAWDADGRDATLVPAEGIRGAHEIRPGLFHDIPGRLDCLACHGDRTSPVLGFSALQLSSDRDPLAPHAETPPEGAADLRALLASGAVRGFPTAAVGDAPRIEAATPRARAAMGYLHANCGSCHGANAGLSSLGMSFEWSVASRESRALGTTVGVEARFRFPAGAEPAATERVVPGDPARSVLARRMGSRFPASQMPPLGTHAVDPEGLALVTAWIREDLRPAPSVPLSPPLPHSQE